jgi:hypothetical protein
VPVPVPAAGEALVRVSRAALDHRDNWLTLACTLAFSTAGRSAPTGPARSWRWAMAPPPHNRLQGSTHTAVAPVRASQLPLVLDRRDPGEQGTEVAARGHCRTLQQLVLLAHQSWTATMGDDRGSEACS